jgi:spore photoproduct lyase
LAAYLGSEAVIRFGNLNQALIELAGILKTIEEAESDRLPTAWPAERSYRFCTGEFTDSLIYDQQFGVSQRLIQLFRDQTKSCLELKTKTADLERLMELDHGGRTVLSFSVNAPAIAESLEPLAAPLISRLAAAGRAASFGYPIGLHFDPIVHHQGWRAGYGATIDLIDQFVPWDRIAWISLGCFRYLAPLKNALLTANPSELFNEEFTRGHDGKLRYPRPLRQLLYQGLLERLRPHLDPRTTVYLCMESSRMWLDLFGFDPTTLNLTNRFREPFLTQAWEPIS